MSKRQLQPDQNLPTVIEATLNAEGTKIAIIASRFNELIVQKLVGGASDAFLRHGAKAKDITIVWVPGAWEIPLATKLWAKKDVDAIICVGAVIRGGTPHFDYVASEVSKGIAQVSMQSEKVISMGILTTDNLQQALERAGSKMGNKGWEAATAAIEMINLQQLIKEA